MKQYFEFEAKALKYIYIYMERSSKALRNDEKFKAVWLLLISLAKLFVSPQLISKYFI